MGFNTTVVVMNDALDFIRRDPEFGEKLAEAVMIAQSRRELVDVSATPACSNSIFCNAATVIESHHADISVLVSVGENSGEVVTDPNIVTRARNWLARKRDRRV